MTTSGDAGEAHTHFMKIDFCAFSLIVMTMKQPLCVLRFNSVFFFSFEIRCLAWTFLTKIAFFRRKNFRIWRKLFSQKQWTNIEFLEVNHWSEIVEQERISWFVSTNKKSSKMRICSKANYFFFGKNIQQRMTREKKK